MSVAESEPLGEVVAALQRAGLEVGEALEELRVVSGSVKDSDLPGLETVPGVQAVERAQNVRLPAPEAPLQ